jgi:hypothetical protein
MRYVQSTSPYAYNNINVEQLNIQTINEYSTPAGSGGNPGIAPSNSNAGHPCNLNNIFSGYNVPVCVYGLSGEVRNGGNTGITNGIYSSEKHGNTTYHWSRSVISGGGGGGGYGGGAAGIGGMVNYSWIGPRWLPNSQKYVYFEKSTSAGGGAGGSLVPSGGNLSVAAGSGGVGLQPGRDGRVFIRGAP